MKYLVASVVAAILLGQAIPPASSSGGTSSAVTRSFTCAESLAVNQPAYVRTDGTVALATAASTATVPAIGFVSSRSGPTTAVVQMSGVLSGFSGLSVGSTYFLATDGGFITTPPAATGNVVQKIVVAVSATELAVNPVLDFTVR